MKKIIVDFLIVVLFSFVITFVGIDLIGAGKKAHADVGCVDKTVNQIKAEQHIDRNDIDKVFLHYIYDKCNEVMPDYEWTTNLTGDPADDKRVMIECYQAKVADFRKANGPNVVLTWQIEKEIAGHCAIAYDDNNNEILFGTISQEYLDAEGGE